MKQKSLSTDNRLLVSVVLVCFFLSGVSALVYQIVWVRMLTLTFGSTAFAVSAVLSAFMGGLALGSYFFGRISDKVKSPVLFYIVLEIGIGLYGVVTPFIFEYGNSIYASFAVSSVESFYVLSLARFSIAFIIILIGTTFMGGTLPVLARFYADKADRVGSDVGFLYATNTFGAVLGAFLAGFLFIPFAGVLGALYIAVAINILIGIVLWVTCLDKKRLSESFIDLWHSLLEKSESALTSEKINGNQKIILLAFALSGFAALGYEVLWTRVLSLIIGSSVYAFTTMVVTFLAGIALGSFIMSRMLSKIKGREYLFFAIIQSAIVVSIYLAIFLAGKLPLLLFSLVQLVPKSFIGIEIIQFSMASAVMLPSTILIGLIFPLVVKMYTKSIEGLGSTIGKLYASNTIGTIVGAFTAGFIFIPLFGSETSFKVFALVNMLLAVVFFIGFSELEKSRARTFSVGLILISTLLFIITPVWNPLLLNSNFPNMLRVVVEKPDVLKNYLKSEVVGTWEDISGNVLVYGRDDGSLNINVSGHAEGGTYSGDMPVQVELAAIPSILHPAPEKVLLVGLGAGITLGALEGMEGVEEVDLVEISTGVIEANSLFNKYNNNALDDNRLNVVVDDARHFINSTDKKYDLIISGPSYSWVSGAANLFTKEYFELARDHTAENGLVAFWFHLYNSTPSDVKIMVATLKSVFPSVTLWLSSSGNELVVLGAKSSLVIDYGRLSKRLKNYKLSKDMYSSIFHSTESFVGRYFMDEESSNVYSLGMPLNTDDKPLLEFSVPRHLFDWDLEETMTSLVDKPRRVKVPIRNYEHKNVEFKFYPFIGLKSKLEEWNIEGYYSNMFNFTPVRGGDKKRLLIDTTPVLEMSLEESVFELRGFSEVDSYNKDQVSYLMNVLGVPYSEVNRSKFDNRSLAWTSREVGSKNIYVFSFYCDVNAMQYLGRLEHPVSDISFDSFLGRLDKGLDCYKEE